jgi:thiamine pyrophosphokinase
MPAYQHVWVFAGGDFCPNDVPESALTNDDVGYVAVDRGVEHCLTAGVVPSLLIGDFDSANPAILSDPRLEGVPKKSFPISKDASDLELALRLLAEEPPTRVTLVGVSGGRTDHMLFNWLMPVMQDWPFELDIVDSTVHAFVVTPERNLDRYAVNGQLLSLIAPTDCAGVSLSGVEYPLAGANIKSGSTIGLSNRVMGEVFSLTVTQGKLLVLLVRDLE